MIDYYVIVIGGGRPTSTVRALSRKADCVLPNTAITGATCDHRAARSSSPEADHRMKESDHAF